MKGFDSEEKVMLGYLDEPFEFILDTRFLENIFKPEFLETKRF